MEDSHAQTPHSDRRRRIRRVVAATPVLAQDKSIVVASTTSTQDSGLFEYLLPSTSRRPASL